MRGVVGADSVLVLEMDGWMDGMDGWDRYGGCEAREGVRVTTDGHEASTAGDVVVLADAV